MKEEGFLTRDRLAEVTNSKWSAVQYLYDTGVLTFPALCPACKNGVSFKRDPKTVLKSGKDPTKVNGCFTYRCKNRKCSWERSIFENTFFFGNKKPPHDVLLLLHLWLQCVGPQGMTVGANLIKSPTSKPITKKAVLDYSREFRKIVSAHLLDYLDDDHDVTQFLHEAKIGGDGITVQIDEVGVLVL
jgi:hypothetical protein